MDIDYTDDSIFPTRGLIPAVDAVRDRRIAGMKHATKQEANAARLAALKASREKRTYDKHKRWAEEMRAAGWVCVPKLPAQITDREGDVWTLAEDSLYRLSGDRGIGWTYEEVRKTYGIREA